MTCLSGWPFIYSLSVRKFCQPLKADCTETIKRVVKPSKEPIKTVNEARLLPPSGEASTHSDIIKTRRACKPLYSLFSLKKKGICSTGIKCILMYIIKIIKRVTSNQGSLTSRSNLSCTFINRKKKRLHSLSDTFGWYWTSLWLIISFMHTSYVTAKRLHPFKGFAAIIANEAFPLGVDGLVPVERARRDERLSAYFTPVRPFARVRPDVSCEVGAVAETLLAHGAAVRPLFILLAVVQVAGVEGQTGLLQAAPQPRRRWHKVFNVWIQVVQMLVFAVMHPEIPVAPLLLLLDHRGLWMLLLHAAAALVLLLLLVFLAVLVVLSRFSCRKWLMVLLFGRRRRRWLMEVSRAILLVWKAVLQPRLCVEYK